MASWEVVSLEDSLVSQHFEVGLILGDIRSVNRGHARFLSHFVNDLLFFVGTGSDRALRPIHHVLVDAALFEARVLREGADARLRLILVLIASHISAIVHFLGEVGTGRLLLRISKLQKSSSHLDWTILFDL